MTRSITATMLLLTLLAAPAAAQDCVDYGDYLHWHDPMELEGGRDVEVTGNLVIMATGDSGNGLQIIDIGDPSSPQLLSQLDVGIRADFVELLGTHAFVAENDLAVVDFSNPVNPSIVAWLDVGNLGQMDLQASYLYAYDSSLDGMHVIDVGDPESPAAVGWLPLDYIAGDIVVSGDHAYVSNWADGLLIVDITDPTDPQVVGSYDWLVTAAYMVAVQGDTAYFSDRLGGAGDDLYILDVSDPTDPVLVDRHYIQMQGDWIRGLEIAGDLLYLIKGYEGLEVMDVGDPMAPVVVGSLDAGTIPLDIELAGDLLCLAGTYSEFCCEPQLRIADISNPHTPGLVGTWTTGGDIVDAALATPYILTANGSSGMDIVDVSDPANPLTAGVLGTPGTPAGIAVAGDLAYMADGENGLQIIDISALPMAGLLGAAACPGSANDVAVGAEHAYVTDGDGLVVLDITDPGSPYVAGSMSTSGSANAVFVDADEAIAWVGSGRRLNAIDITDPTDPSYLDGVQVPGYYSQVAPGVARAGDYAFLVCDDPEWRACVSTLYVVDVSDPTDLAIVGSVAVPGATKGMTLAGYDLYLPCGEAGLQMLDISDPLQPVVLGAVNSEGEANGVAVGSNLFYCADGPAGLFIAGRQCDIWTAVLEEGAIPSLTLRAAYPNPFNPKTTIRFELAASAHARLAVHDLAGRLVRVLVDESLPAGEHAAVWDGRDASGARVASGVYLYRLSGAGGAAAEKMLLLN